MRDSLRQLWLLTQKNLILTRRNKVWTLFELILPVIFLLPVTLLVVRGGTVQLSPSWSIESVPLEGGAGDFSFGEFKSIPMRWCGRRLVFIAYSTHENRESVEDIMNELAARFSSSSIKVNVEYIKDEAHMLDELRADAPYSDDFGTCSINKFAGGLIFNQFDTKAAKLDYKLLIPAGTSRYDRWNEEWGDPFDLYRGTARWFRVPYEPPYWSSAFLSIQYCIDSLFIEASSAKITIPPKLRLRRMPVASYSLNGVAVFLAISSYVWGLCVFILVMHTTREIVSEKSTVKDFLSVMGLSTPVFYLSHVLYATGKCFIVFLICVTPLTFHIEPVNVSLFLVTIALYGVSAIVFAALISSLFKTPNTALKVVIVLWIILVAARSIAPRVDQILFCVLYSLNPNAALYYVLKTIADYKHSGDLELSWSRSFEGFTHHFTPGAALVMLLVDIIWMGMATLFFDFMFSDSDFTLFKLSFGRKYLSGSVTSPEQNDSNKETDEGLLKTQAGISVRRLVKICMRMLKYVWGFQLLLLTA